MSLGSRAPRPSRVGDFLQQLPAPGLALQQLTLQPSLRGDPKPQHSDVDEQSCKMQL